MKRRLLSARSLVAPLLGMTVLLAATAAALGAQPQAGRPVSLNFENARVTDVVRSVAAMLGLNVVFTDVPDRRISFNTAAPIRPDEIAGVLESILESNNLVLVQKGAVAQVVPADKAPATGQVRVGADISDPPPLGLITQLVPLQSIRADEGAAALKQVAGPLARIEPVARSNALLITDRGVNIARYLQLLRTLDERPQGESGLRTYVVPLKYANAEDLAYALGQSYEVSVASGRGPSLADRSLSRNLDVFRGRELDTFRQRQQTPVVVNMPGAGRDSTGVDSLRPGALVGRTTVVPDPPTNSLIIRTAPPNYPLLRETIEALDTKPAQVLFEVAVAEVTLGRGDQFGIDWSVYGRDGGVSLGDPIIADSVGVQDFVMRVVTLDRFNVRAVLRALSSKSQVKVLSTPEILAVNNREARIVVGSKVPFIASTRLGNDVAIDRAVQYQDVGTTLTIIPTINQDDYVSVQILQEVSNLTNQTIQAALNAPVISTREATTRAIIRDGQTVVIGGLIGNTRERIESGVPLLKDIPLLGYFFKRETITTNRTELAIFVTPYVVRSDEDADAARERARKRLEDAEKKP
jgi:general secretion pathway protein D